MERESIQEHMASKKQRRVSRTAEGAVAAEELQQPFPKVDLPIRPPYPPMEAKLVDEIPSGSAWSYEPKWDGFRCLAFRSGTEVVLQSKAGQPLGRYFPELLAALAAFPQKKFVLDGEIVITRNGSLSFDDLLMRIHPAASRIRKLSAETPSDYLVFDILVDEQGKPLTELPLDERRQHLVHFFKKAGGRQNERIRLSPSTRRRSEAERWMRELGASGLDGVIAKRSDEPYHSGQRSMQKIKRIRTADCVVGGFRYAQKGGAIGSLLLGLYNQHGLLDHVGFTSSFNAKDRSALRTVIKPYQGGSGFSGNAPGGPSRWSTRRSEEWKPLEPKLVCEVRYDHFSGGRFRHGTKFLRWRPDKDPRQCTFDQVQPSRRGRGLEEFGFKKAA
jgi:ATP-dependent DNA ligase